MRIVSSRTFALSVAGVAAAAALCVAALVRALVVEPVEFSAVPAGIAARPELPAAALAPARVPSEGILGAESLTLAVDHDPFMPDRRRAAPYRFPGDVVPEIVTVRQEEPEPPPFRVIGTAVVGESGLALVELLESGAPEVVQVGGSLLGYRLQSVDTESATLVRQSQTLTLAVQSGTAGVSTGERGAAWTADLGAGLQQYQALVEQMRARGMDAGVLGQIMGGRGEVRLFEAAPQRGGRGGRGGRATTPVRRDTLSWLPSSPRQ